MAITQAAIRADLAKRFSDSSATQLTNTEWDLWADKVQQDMARKVRFLKQDKSFALTAGQPYVNLPSDMIRLESAPSYKAMYPFKMVSRSRWYRVAFRAAGLTTGRDPVLAYIEYSRVNASTGWRMWFWPVPSAASTNTTLNGAINASVTSITLTDSSSFPAAGRVIIDSEEIYYSANSGNVLSGCTRGMGATAGAAHSNGATVSLGEIILSYSRIPAGITASINAEIPDEDYETLISGVLAIAFETDRQQKWAALYEARYKAGIQEMRLKFQNPDEAEDNQLQPDPEYEWTWGGDFNDRWP